MQVLKFGGTSVASAENINRTIIVIRRAIQKDRTIVIISAFGGITDMLIQCGKLAAAGDESYINLLRNIEQRHLEAVKELLPVAQQSSLLSAVKQRCNKLEDTCNGIFLLGELSPRTLDTIMSFGELLSSQIISAKLNDAGIANTWKDAREFIVTDSQFGFALVDFIRTNKNIESQIFASDVSLFIIPGFIATDKNGATTTLGRGGSDYSAAILAAALNASVLEIWTDVSGMMTADPRLVSNARIVPHISYEEAMELSHFGAKVIYPPTIQPVMKKQIPVWIKNTFAPDDYGTVIESSSSNRSIIRGISSIGKMALVSLQGSGMVGIPGFSKRLFEVFSNEKINVILITQSSSEHSICVGIEESFAEKAKTAVDAAFANEIIAMKIEPLIVEKDLSIIAVVGDHMKNHAGISGKMFGALGRNGVNIRAIAQGSSEKNISAVISTQDVKKAVNVLHEDFFETTYKQLNLFVLGTGNVSSRLLAQLQLQKKFLLDHFRLQLRLVGLANSRQMIFNDEGISLENWNDDLQQGERMNLNHFIEIVQSKNLRNSVLADITASAEIANCYDQLLTKSISVVACNKLACSSSYEYYKRLKMLAGEFNAQFLFETNVGAGLPVIGTLNDLLRSGDRIHMIEAVLSGTLNYVFNYYNGEKTFASIVRDAQREGYTEPDPRLDLGGTDVMRKIMILAREAGETFEIEDIENQTFLPPGCMKGDVENFYTKMEKHESYFKSLYLKASMHGNKLKFVAKYEKGKASVGLVEIGPQHDFFHLYGKDNVVLFYTDRYFEQPLVVKGAGAGAEVTASGVFADIIRAVRV